MKILLKASLACVVLQSFSFSVLQADQNDEGCQDLSQELSVFYSNCWSNPYDNSQATNFSNCCMFGKDNEGVGARFDASFLYLYPEVSGINQKFVCKDSTDCHELEGIPLRSRFNPNGNFGFRLLAGLDFPCDRFSIFSVWTHQANSCLGAFFNQKGKWKFHYDTADLLIEWKKRPATWLVLNPYFGARIAWTNQLLRVILPTGTSLLPFNSFFTRYPQIALHYTGGGALLGCEAELFKSECGSCGIFWASASFTATALYGVQEKEIKHIDLFTILSPKQKWRQNTHRLLAGIEASGALHYEVVGLRFGIGCEYHRYFNAQGIFKEGDFELLGANLSIGTSF